MITPYFTISQDEEFLHVSVKVSHIRFSASSIEMVADSNVFVFSLPPYYLRLRLPFSVVDDERAKAEFDSKSSCVNIWLPKEDKGQFFPNLDLTAKLLARKDEHTVNSQTKPLIEELDFPKPKDHLSSEHVANDGEVHDWEISQNIEPETASGSTYGFNNAYKQIVGVSVASGNDIIELGDPESSSTSDRIMERLIKENIKFDPEYYAADYIMEKNPSNDDDKIYSGAMNWKSPTTRQFLTWYKTQSQLPQGERESIITIEFTKQDHERMLELPKRTYLIDEIYKPQLWMLLITLLFAHQFDLRENEGEHNVESAWTIGKLAPQFSCLDSQILIPNPMASNVLEATIVTVTRRSLCYPFHRHYGLARKAWDDVYYVLRSGKRVVLKCLLDLRELFRYHDIYYVYDKIWLEDLCSWILSDQVSENALRHLAHDFKRKLDDLKKSDITFEKVDETKTGDDMIALDIAELEQMADESYASFLSQY